MSQREGTLDQKAKEGTRKQDRKEKGGKNTKTFTVVNTRTPRTTEFRVVNGKDFKKKWGESNSGVAEEKTGAENSPRAHVRTVGA